jgi:nitrite reductase/ring-hydroxylating ferredoxin subunit
MHGWSFDVVTGACHVNPQDRIRILPVRVVDGEIRVEV